MFESLHAVPEDPLLGIITAYARDTDAGKIDLGVGVYKTEQGDTPIPAAVRTALSELAAAERTKVYLGAAGNARFNAAILRLTNPVQLQRHLLRALLDNQVTTPIRATALSSYPFFFPLSFISCDFFCQSR